MILLRAKTLNRINAINGLSILPLSRFSIEDVPRDPFDQRCYIVYQFIYKR